MASISTQRNGGRVIQFTGADKKRRSIRLGKMPMRTAQAVKARVERLISAALAGFAPDDETSRWVAELDDSLADKLARAGLIPQRQCANLAEFMAASIKGRNDVEPATKTVWRQGERSLIEFFGADRPVKRITKAETEAFKQALIGEGYALYTVRKRLQVAKMFFGEMKQRGLIVQNPFDGVQVAAVVDESRNVFVPRADIELVIEACPDAEWRLIVALSRYAGLRCPSETLSLRWDCIDWERQRIRVISPKTKAHPGGGQRIIPLFPDLAPYLTEAFEAAPDGATHVITHHRSQADGPGKWKNSNLRTMLAKIIWRAGLDTWPKPFHALRASLETELVERFPIQAVSAWLGNSPKVALKHYLRVLPEHFDRALEGAAGALQNAVQYPAERPRTASQRKTKTLVLQGNAKPCGSVQSSKRMGRDSNPRYTFA